MALLNLWMRRLGWMAACVPAAFVVVVGVLFLSFVMLLEPMDDCMTLREMCHAFWFAGYWPTRRDCPTLQREWLHPLRGAGGAML